MIAIVDYDAGNIMSVKNALDYLKVDARLSRDTEEIKRADKIILPGVGAFEDAMTKLNSLGLCETLKDAVKNGTPFLGICLGLQLMFEKSEESQNDVDGLGILPGKIHKFPNREGYKIPHMGWNSLSINPKSKLFTGIKNDSYVYFVHSYYLEADNNKDVAATSNYIKEFHAAVEHENVFATQFHPEKSGDVGMKILQNFCDL